MGHPSSHHESVQPLNETVCARFLNHERDVEVAGRLGNEMDLLLLKDL